LLPWGTTCFGGVFSILKEGLSARYLDHIRWLAWRLVLDWRTPGVRRDHVGGGPREVHGNIIETGGTSCFYQFGTQIGLVQGLKLE